MRIRFLSLNLVSRRDWLDGVIVDGGGVDNNWSVWYDPAGRRFMDASPFDSESYKKYHKRDQ